MKAKQELLDTIDELKELVKPWNKFIDLFSKDVAKSTMAKINKLLSRIRLELKLAKLKEVRFPTGKAVRDTAAYDVGSLVKIRPVHEEYGGKTYLGFLLGEIATSISIGVDDDAITAEYSHYNPAIFVPELNRVIYGYESWWGVIKDESELLNITDKDIENVWYVQHLKKMLNV